MNKPVIVYSAPGCNECDMVKQLLAQEGIPFQVRDVLTNPEYQAEVERFGFLGVPVTVVGDQAVKGFNPAELKKLVDTIAIN